MEGTNWRLLLLRRGFPGGSDGKESVCNAGDLGSTPGSGRPSGEGNGNPLQYSCLENSTDRGYSSWGPKELDMTEQLMHNTTLWKICLVLKELVLKIEQEFFSLQDLPGRHCRTGESTA